jgi:hypothetical protein
MFSFGGFEGVFKPDKKIGGFSALFFGIRIFGVLIVSGTQTTQTRKIFANNELYIPP